MAHRRWDGRTWIARTILAVVPVLVLGGTGSTDLSSAVGVACVWIPLISATSWLQLRHQGTVQRFGSLLVDVAALWLLAVVAPALVPTVLVLLVATGMVHAGGLADLAERAGALAAVFVVQGVVAATGGLDAHGTWLLVVFDVAGLLLGTLMLEEQDQHRRRSTAALHRADELTGAVLAGIGEAVVVTDATGTITSTNDAAELTFGHEPTGSCHEALTLHRGAGALDCSRGCPLLDAESGLGQAEVVRDHPGGTRQALLANVRAVRTPTGRLREVVHSYRDVTALKQAEQAKTLFLATASHELKTPVAVIAGYVSLLEQGDLPQQQRDEALATVRSRTRQLSQIIDRLLLASRIEGGGLSLSTRPTPLLPIVRDRVHALREVTRREIVTEIPDALPPVDGDATAVATVLEHLVENAVKYSPDGGRVVVTVRLGEETVELDVADEGVGMSRRDAEQCFDAFWQAESDDTRRFGGSGVGLYIVRSLSRAMGGDTTVVCAVPGKGTTLRVTLLRSDVVRPTGPADTGPQARTMIDEFMRQVGVGGGR